MGKPSGRSPGGKPCHHRHLQHRTGRVPDHQQAGNRSVAAGDVHHPGTKEVDHLAMDQQGHHHRPDLPEPAPELEPGPGQQRAPVPQQPYAGSPPPSCEPSILCGSP